MKGFFSVALVLFVLFITMFFVSINNNSNPILFDDSPRLLALKSEEAYLIADQNLTLDYINYNLPNIAIDCNTKAKDLTDFPIYLKNKYPSLNPVKVNDYCFFRVRNAVSKPVTANSFNVEINAEIDCIYTKDSDLNYTFNKKSGVVFNKRYQSYSDAGKCHFILHDLDSQLTYVNVLK